MTDAETGRRALLRTEARIAIVANAIMSIGFFLLVFGWSTVDARALAVDFLPQTFGVTFLGTLIPSLLTYRRIADGSVVPVRPPVARTRHALRILACAAAATLVLGGAAALLFPLVAPAKLAPAAALAIKTVYGAAVGYVVTPPVLRMLLGMPVLARGAAPAAAAR